MKTNLSLSAALFTMAVVCLPVRGEQNVASSADATSASAAVASAPEMPAEPVIIDHVVYLGRLPTPAQLLQGAKTQGSTIVRMDQTSDRLVVVYQYSGGRNVTFAYTLLSAAGNYPAPAGRTDSMSVPVSQAVYTETVTAPVVIYRQPDTIYYSSGYRRSYDPAWDFWAPLTLGLGIGLIGGHSHGGWYGGHSSHGGHGGHGGHR